MSNLPRITDQDQQCLLMLWKWKLLTTTALHALVYKDKSMYGAYTKLLAFEDAGLVQSIRSYDSYASVWQLRERGYKVISTKLHNLRHEGFKSEHKDHDFWVSAIHLGNWINGIPENCGIYSEQQLRKVHGDFYPDWVPSLYQHRPDGWWSIGVKQSRERSLIALEVELSQKTKVKYKLVGEFYSKIVHPYQVIWVVRSKGEINYIFNNIKSGSTTEAREQSFILLEDYIQSQWQSQIVFGKNIGKSIADIIPSLPQVPPKAPWSKLLLDVRKYPVNLKGPRFVEKIEIGLSR